MKMNRYGHIKFGKIVCEEFDVPKEYKEWAVAPDYKFIWRTKEQNKYLHRFTYHGMPNVDKLIEKARKSDSFPYRDEYKEEIELMVVSHSFFDLFNSIIVPSYPKNSKFKYVPGMGKYYLKPRVKDPDELESLFRYFVRERGSPTRLKTEMLVDYKLLPNSEGELVTALKNHYDKYL